MKILFLSRWFPFPANNGSKMRIAGLLRALSRDHEVTLISFSDDTITDAQEIESRSLCKQIVLVKWKPYDPHSIRSKLGYFHPKPRFIVDTFSPEMAGQINKIIDSNKIDLVIASQIDMASYIRFFHIVPAIFEELESGIFSVFDRKEGSLVSRIRKGLTVYKWQSYLRRLLPEFKAVTVVSEREQDIIRQTNPGLKNLFVIPNCIDLMLYEDVQEEPKPGELIFTGSFKYMPNYEAALWFLNEIFPLIKIHIPNIKLTITGDHENRPIPDDRNVILTGYLDDIKPLITKSWSSVVPIRSGGGTRLKILESMALGTPVVATSKGAEGLKVHPGQHLLIADTPKEFATAVIRLETESGLREEIAENGRQFLIKNYDCKVVMPLFLDMVRKVGEETTSGMNND